MSDGVFFLQLDQISTGYGVDIIWTHPKSNQNTLLLHHMRDPPGNMDNPCSDCFEGLIKDVYLAVYICNKDTDGRGSNRCDFERVLDNERAADECLVCVADTEAVGCVP